MEGVEYKITVSGKNTLGIEGPKQQFSFKVMPKEQKSRADDPGASSQLTLKGPATTWSKAEYFVEAVIDTCEPQIVRPTVTSIEMPKGKMLNLREGMLQGGKEYNISSTCISEAKDSAQKTEMTASMTVTLLSQGIQAQVSIQEVTIGTGQSLELDASLSQDLDKKPGDLQFSWCCRTQSGNRCLLPRPGEAATLESAYKDAFKQPILKIPEGSLPTGKYIFTVEVSKGGITSKAQTIVEVVVGVPPTVTSSNGGQQSYVNPKEGVTIPAVVMNTREGCRMWWSVQQEPGHEYFNLAEVVGLGDVVTVTQKEARDVTGREFPLVIPGPTGTWPGLKNSAAYKFRLSIFCPQQGKLQSSLSHSDFVTPVKGEALRTKFAFSTAAAEDVSTDYPLLYKYGFQISEQEQINFFSSSNEALQATTILPCVSGTETIIIPVLTVCDVHKLCTTITGQQVTTKLPNNFTLAEVQEIGAQFSEYISSQQYLEAQTFAQLSLQTLKQMPNQGLYTAGVELIETEIRKELKRKQDGLNGTPVSLQSSLDFLDMSISVLKYRLKYTSFPDRHSNIPKLRRRRSTTTDKGSTSIFLSIHALLRVSEAVIKSGNETIIKAEKEKLLKEIHQYVYHLCVGNELKMKNVKIFVNSALVQFSVEKLSSQDHVMKTEFHVPNRVKGPPVRNETALVHLGKAVVNKLKSSGNTCLGGIYFPADYLTDVEIRRHKMTYKKRENSVFETILTNIGKTSEKRDRPLILKLPINSDIIEADQTVKCAMVLVDSPFTKTTVTTTTSTITTSTQRGSYSSSTLSIPTDGTIITSSIEFPITESTGSNSITMPLTGITSSNIITSTITENYKSTSATIHQTDTTISPSGTIPSIKSTSLSYSTGTIRSSSGTVSSTSTRSTSRSSISSTGTFSSSGTTTPVTGTIRSSSGIDSSTGTKSASRRTFSFSGTTAPVTETIRSSSGIISSTGTKSASRSSISSTGTFSFSGTNATSTISSIVSSETKSLSRSSISSTETFSFNCTTVPITETIRSGIATIPVNGTIDPISNTVSSTGTISITTIYIYTTLRVSEAMIKSGNEADVLREKEKLLSDIHKYIYHICVGNELKSNDNKIYINSPIVQFSVEKLLSRDHIKHTEFRLPNRVKGQPLVEATALVNLGKAAANKFGPSGVICLGGIHFPEDYLTDVAVGKNGGKKSYKKSPVFEAKLTNVGKAPEKLDEPLTLKLPVGSISIEANECALWQDNVWTVDICETGNITYSQSYAYIVCKCMVLGYFTVVAVDSPSTTTTASTSTASSSTSPPTTTLTSSSSSTSSSTTVSSTTSETSTETSSSSTTIDTTSVSSNIKEGECENLPSDRLEGVPVSNATYNISFKIEEDFKAVVGENKEKEHHSDSHASGYGCEDDKRGDTCSCQSYTEWRNSDAWPRESDSACSKAGKKSNVVVYAVVGCVVVSTISIVGLVAGAFEHSIEGTEASLARYRSSYPTMGTAGTLMMGTGMGGTQMMAFANRAGQRYEPQGNGNQYLHPDVSYNASQTSKKKKKKKQGIQRAGSRGGLINQEEIPQGDQDSGIVDGYTNSSDDKNVRNRNRVKKNSNGSEFDILPGTPTDDV
ncbi:hypothetical protein C0J52_15939 [Blattella germanica]|nr:hypothetical protein C0J52_15939 [Blattella germanica]